jgi:hypothetical protein
MELAVRFLQVGDGQAQITLGRVERAMAQDILPWRRLTSFGVRTLRGKLRGSRAYSTAAAGSAWM